MSASDHLFITINYRTSNEVALLLNSFLMQRELNWRLVIKDNSEDAEETARLERLIENCSRATLHPSNDNVGYFRAANEVLGGIDPQQYETVSICNADVSLANSTFIGILNGCVEFDNNVLIVAPDINAIHQGIKQNPFMRTRPTVFDAIRRRLYFASRRSTSISLRLAPVYQGLRARMVTGVTSAKTAIAERSFDIYAPHGSFIIFRREYFSRGNDFEHPSVLFGEEMTVAERVLHSGGRVVYYPRLRVDHREHASMGGKKAPYILDAMVESGRLGVELYVFNRYKRGGVAR